LLLFSDIKGCSVRFKPRGTTAGGGGRSIQGHTVAIN